jgi:hypothetical protein
MARLRSLSAVPASATSFRRAASAGVSAPTWLAFCDFTSPIGPTPMEPPPQPGPQNHSQAFLLRCTPRKASRRREANRLAAAWCWHGTPKLRRGCLNPLQHDRSATPDNFLMVVHDALIKNYKAQTLRSLALADVQCARRERDIRLVRTGHSLFASRLKPGAIDMVERLLRGTASRSQSARHDLAVQVPGGVPQHRHNND